METRSVNKKQLILLTSVLIGGIGIVILLFYTTSFKTVHFLIKKQAVQVEIHQDQKSNVDKIATLSTNGDLKLKKGDYSAVVLGENYDNTPIRFSIKDDDKTVTITPQYSFAYLEAILAKEEPAALAVLNGTYKAIMDGFTVGQGSVYLEGQWYATTLTQKTPLSTEQGDVYRTVLKKENGTWTVKAAPAIVLTTKEHPDIPKEILSDINTR